MKVYQGTGTLTKRKVTVNGIPLDPHFEVRRHCPTGFNWGYLGSGPAQLALAILMDFSDGDVDFAQDFYQTFKVYVIAQLEGDWELTYAEIDQFLADIMDT